MRSPWVFIAVLFFAANARAAPTLDVRARATLDLHPTRTDDGTTHVRVVLTDDIGAPIRRGRVALVLRLNDSRCGVASNCLTDASGVCEARLAGCIGSTVAGEYEGWDEMDGANVVVPVLDHAAEPRVQVRLPGGTIVDLDTTTTRVEVLIDGVSSMPAHITLTDEIGHTILRQRIPASASIDLSPATESLGPPGLGSIIGTVEFDDRSHATGRVMVTRRLRSSLTLRRATHELVGTLRNARGPIANVLVTLVSGTAVVATTRTDARGESRFPFEVDAEAHRFAAHYDPNDPGHSPARSSIVVIAAAPSRTWLAYAPLVSFAIVCAVFVVLRRREPTKTSVETRTQRPHVAVEVSARRNLVASETRVRLRVLRREDDAPIADARVDVEGEGIRLDDEGDGTHSYDFRTPAKHHSLFVDAPGRVPERIKVRVPHRGEWTDAVVRLETTRAHARRAIETVARAVRSDDDAAETITVREADTELAPTSDLAFADDTEHLVYGPAAPALEDARAIVVRARARATAASRP